jgi:hypothetical protein
VKVAQKVVLIKGTNQQVEQTKKEIKKMFENDDNHVCKYEINRFITNSVFDELSALCKQKFSVQMKQSMGLHLNELTIKGKNCKEAKKWLVEKLPDLLKLNFPDDWLNPV